MFGTLCLRTFTRALVICAQSLHQSEVIPQSHPLADQPDCNPSLSTEAFDVASDEVQEFSLLDLGRAQMLHEFPDVHDFVS